VPPFILLYLHLLVGIIATTGRLTCKQRLLLSLLRYSSRELVYRPISRSLELIQMPSVDVHGYDHLLALLLKAYTSRKTKI
jgi:hypothetical protein